MHYSGRVRPKPHIQVLDFFAENATHDPTSRERKIPVVPIAPQSLSSLSASFSTAVVAPRYMLHHIEAFLYQALGIGHVYGTHHIRPSSLSLEIHQRVLGA
jgi:hypothetical protein